MPIEVVLREAGDCFKILSVEGLLGPEGYAPLIHKLNVILGNGGTHHYVLLMKVAAHLIFYYPGRHWSIKVNRIDGYVYWLRFDAPELAVQPPTVSEELVPRVSRYSRKPVI